MTPPTVPEPYRIEKGVPVCCNEDEVVLNLAPSQVMQDSL